MDQIIFSYRYINEDKDLKHPDNLGFIFKTEVDLYVIYKANIYRMHYDFCGSPDLYVGTLIHKELFEHFKGKLKFK